MQTLHVFVRHRAEFFSQAECVFSQAEQVFKKDSINSRITLGGRKVGSSLKILRNFFIDELDKGCRILFEIVNFSSFKQVKLSSLTLQHPACIDNTVGFPPKNSIFF